jgi:hypothetical protein
VAADAPVERVVVVRVERAVFRRVVGFVVAPVAEFAVALVDEGVGTLVEAATVAPVAEFAVALLAGFAVVPAG